MRVRSIPFLLALGCAVGLGACDKSGGDSDGEKSDGEEKAKGDGDDDGDGDGDGEAKGEGEGGEAPIDPKEAEIAALKAEIAAVKEAQEAAKALDPEAAKELGEGITAEDELGKEGKLAEGQKGPVSVANVSFTDKDGFGDRGKMFEISAEITVNEEKEGGVYAKASCALGEEVFANVATISTKHSDLGKMKVGDTKRLDAAVFTVGLEKLPERCQLAFDYGASQFSTRIADFCWDGKKVLDGTCEEPVAAKAKGGGKVVPFGMQVKTRKPLGRDAVGAALNVRYAARFNEQVERAPHLHLKTSCKVADKTWVEVAPDFPHVKPFTLDSGEALIMRQTQFFTSALPDNPEDCNMVVLLDGGFNEPDEKIGEFCFKGSAVSEGGCPGRQPPSGAKEALAADSLELDEFTAAWSPSWSDKTKQVLTVKFAATATKRIADRSQLIGTAKCGKTQDDEHMIGPDLHFLDPGESHAIQMVAFRKAPFDKPAKRCELTFKGGTFLSKEKVEVGKACLKGDKITAGKCGGGGGGGGKKKSGDQKKPKRSISDAKKPRGR